MLTLKYTKITLSINKLFRNKVFKFFTVSKKKKQYEYVIITVNISVLKKQKADNQFNRRNTSKIQTNIFLLYRNWANIRYWAN